VSISVSIVLSSHSPAEFVVDQTPPWRSKLDGTVHNAVAVTGEDWGSTGIQGPPAELRRLARALDLAAAAADAWALANPTQEEITDA
jgi:hypothetical protein